MLEVIGGYCVFLPQCCLDSVLQYPFHWFWSYHISKKVFNSLRKLNWKINVPSNWFIYTFQDHFGSNESICSFSRAVHWFRTCFCCPVCNFFLSTKLFLRAMWNTSQHELVKEVVLRLWFSRRATSVGLNCQRFLSAVVKEAQFWSLFHFDESGGKTHCSSNAQNKH